MDAIGHNHPRVQLGARFPLQYWIESGELRNGRLSEKGGAAAERESSKRSM